MPQIKDIMTRDCKWVAPEMSLGQAARIMADRDFGFLPVGENNRLIGMLTDRDIVIRGVAESCDPETTTVRDVMTPQTLYCYDDQDVEEVCENMAETKVRRMPVMNRSKKLVGVVSLGDLSQIVNPFHIGETEHDITAHGHAQMVA